MTKHKYDDERGLICIECNIKMKPKYDSSGAWTFGGTDIDYYYCPDCGHKF